MNKRVALIGCGNIGSKIASAIDKKIIPAELVAIYDKIVQRSKNLKLKTQKPKVCNSIQAAIKDCDLIIEAASQEAVKEIVSALKNEIASQNVAESPLLQARNDIIRQPKNTAVRIIPEIFIMSVGALLNYPEIEIQAKKHNFKIYFPAGAIAGLDALKAAKLSKIKSVILTTTKPPESLGIKTKISNPKVIFDGSAKSAVKKFPANINVSAAISSCGMGPEKTRVRIIADPKIKTNIHKIEVVSKAGKITTETENIPSKENPKTSYLAVLSAIAELKEICCK